MSWDWFLWAAKGIALPALLLTAVIGAAPLLWIMAPLPKKWETEFGFDTSNRINRLRLLWWMLTRPYLFLEGQKWLGNDELENIRDAN